MRSFFSIFSLAICAIILTYLVGCFYAYFYPMKYKDEIYEYSSQYQVEAALVASIANTESGFNEKSCSSKGAVGIMQLMPSTAKWLADKMGEQYSEGMLYDGSYNIKLGSYYISYLISQFEDEKVALCAYNAGQGNVREWLKNSEFSADGKTLDKIPFKETKNYISKVYKNYNYYKNRYK